MGRLTTVTRGSQITLTRDVREKVGIREGDRVVLSVVGNTIVVAKKDPAVFDKIGRFLPDNFEEILKKTRTDDRERLKRIGVI